MSQSPHLRAILCDHVDPQLGDDLERHQDTPHGCDLCAIHAKARVDSVDAELDLVDELLDMARDARERGDDASARETLEELNFRYGVPQKKRTELV